MIDLILFQKSHCRVSNAEEPKAFKACSNHRPILEKFRMLLDDDNPDVVSFPVGVFAE